jgi:hypothetical protein
MTNDGVASAYYELIKVGDLEELFRSLQHIVTPHFTPDSPKRDITEKVVDPSISAVQLGVCELQVRKEPSVYRKASANGCPKCHDKLDARSSNGP